MWCPGWMAGWWKDSCCQWTGGRVPNDSIYFWEASALNGPLPSMMEMFHKNPRSCTFYFPHVRFKPFNIGTLMFKQFLVKTNRGVFGTEVSYILGKSISLSNLGKLVSSLVLMLTLIWIQICWPHPGLVALYVQLKFLSGIKSWRSSFLDFDAFLWDSLKDIS